MRLGPVLVLLLSLGLAACYEVRGPTVAEGVRAEAVKDGLWRRSDGSEVTLAWDAAAGAYAIGMGGKVRLAPLGNLWLADYQAERNIVMLAALRGDQVVFYSPTPEAETRLAAAHGLALKPGPIKRLAGEPAARQRYMADLAALCGTGELVEVERLSFVAPL